jgi:hypothetical protein
VLAVGCEAATPTWLEGTTTVTGASGSSPLAVAIAPRSAAAASRPYRVHSTRRAMREIVRRGCDGYDDPRPRVL